MKIWNIYRTRFAVSPVLTGRGHVRAKTNSIRVYTVTQDPVEAPDSELPLRCRKDLASLLKGI